MTRIRPNVRAGTVVTLVVLAAFAGTIAGASSSSDLGYAAAIDPTPSDPTESESTHVVMVKLGTNAENIGKQWNDLVVNYDFDTPKADVSNVDAGSIERIGIDRGNDGLGSLIDAKATIESVSVTNDGHAVRIALAGDLTLQEKDELVAVLRPVQNPQNAGTAGAVMTINSQGTAENASGAVHYEYNSASVTFENQSSTGQAVVVSSVNVSESGFVVIQNVSGAHPEAIRGASTFLTPGPHENVTVQLDEPIANDTELVAQVYTDANLDLQFTFDAEGGKEDWPYRTRDGAIMAADAAIVTVGGDDGGTTATPTTTPTTTPTGTSSGSGSPTPTVTDSTDNGTATSTATTPTATATVSTATGTGTDNTPTTTSSPSSGTDEGTATGSTPTATATPGETTPQKTTTEGIPGFGAAAALVALVAVLVVVIPSNRRT